MVAARKRAHSCATLPEVKRGKRANAHFAHEHVRVLALVAEAAQKDSVRVRFGELVKARRYDFARAAPRRRELDHDKRIASRVYNLVEVVAVINADHEALRRERAPASHALAPRHRASHRSAP
eukprot:CAMPEP_0185835398 /NCGR_PEP_ID=MMETSP1353-20130828/7683_1 /TAXON_ID=1077150 /ORGANISM="Erythrolobus australicus, Strain CCMP3124" /LENGTH=122 /DNA_ID=CAMNT_0028534013 /DNA_START=117 /DNA_END=482 /DNA_ORIENTATION=-